MTTKRTEKAKRVLGDVLPLLPLRPKRRRTCPCCGEQFIPQRSNQRFVNADHRRDFWKQASRALSDELLIEFLAWRRRKVARKKNAESSPAKKPTRKK